MSKESVKKFYKEAETNKDLAKELLKVDLKTSLKAEDLKKLKEIIEEKIIPIAKARGFDFSAEEMLNYANEKYLSLDESDLLNISGGTGGRSAALFLTSVLGIATFFGLGMSSEKNQAYAGGPEDVNVHDIILEVKCYQSLTPIHVLNFKNGIPLVYFSFLYYYRNRQNVMSNNLIRRYISWHT